MTVSQPAGMTAPVITRTASPALGAPSKATPAYAVPITRKETSPASPASSVLAKAKPSIAELSCAGTSMDDRTSSASTRSSALRMGTRATPFTGCTKSRMMACACATGRAFGS